MRTTKNDLHTLARIINNYLGDSSDLTKPYYVQYAYGQPRLEMLDGPGARNISPRLPPGQLALWMEAYIQGIRARRVKGDNHD